MIASTFIVGLKFPYFAAAACGTWTLARFVYTIGYSSGDPKKVRAHAFSRASLVSPRTLVPDVVVLLQRNLLGAGAVNGICMLGESRLTTTTRAR